MLISDNPFDLGNLLIMKLVNHPVLCNYYLTYRCNAKCSFCDIWEIPSPYVDLSSVESNLLDLKRLGVKVIDFTGGEPLLHREIDSILGMAKELGFITTITTNGLLYPKWSKKLKGKIDMLHFSLDYFDRDKHNDARGIDCYDYVIESINIAKTHDERPDILFTVFEDNVEEIQQVYENICLANDLVLILNPVFDYNQVDTGSSLSTKTLDYISSFGRKKGVYLNEAFIQLRRDGGNHINNPICKAATTTLVINPFNELVLPCYHLGEKKFPINSNLFQLYKSTEVSEWKKLEGKLPGCEGCTINCYMQPTFATELNKYWFKAAPSTIKYAWEKGTWKTLVTG